MIYALVAHGPNGLAIPVLFWANKGDATAFIEGLLERHKESFNQDRTTKVVDVGMSLVPTDEVAEYGKGPFEEIFTSFYGGCGGCYCLSLEEFKDGVKSIRWDLD